MSCFKSIIEQIGDIPIIALTATATPKVQLDIQKNLEMDEAVVFKSSFNRTNLYYEVRPKSNTKKQLIQKVAKSIKECLQKRRLFFYTSTTASGRFRPFVMSAFGQKRPVAESLQSEFPTFLHLSDLRS